MPSGKETSATFSGLSAIIFFAPLSPINSINKGKIVLSNNAGVPDLSPYLLAMMGIPVAFLFSTRLNNKELLT
ncbi:hypothetical protein D3C83_246710 [compost metagenome]